MGFDFDDDVRKVNPLTRKTDKIDIHGIVDANRKVRPKPVIPSESDKPSLLSCPTGCPLPEVRVYTVDEPIIKKVLFTLHILRNSEEDTLRKQYAQEAIDSILKVLIPELSEILKKGE